MSLPETPFLNKESVVEKSMEMSDESAGSLFDPTSAIRMNKNDDSVWSMAKSVGHAKNRSNALSTVYSLVVHSDK